jgi:hypothetical protein
MIALHILDIKEFMAKLLTSDTFDHFLLSEATITTYNTFVIDGKINKEFYSYEELEDLVLSNQIYSYWKTMKPFCFELIKGKKTPLNFKYIFLLSPHNVIRLLEIQKISILDTDINGLFLNIKYDGTTLSCITGLALKTFTMDKTLEYAWDDMIKKFLTHQNIAFEEQ